MGSVETIGRMLIALAVVLLVIWLIGRGMRRGRRGSGALLDVMARRQLGKHSSVTVVRLGDTALVLGVTEGHVTLLGQADVAALDPARTATPTPVPAARALRPVGPPRRVAAPARPATPAAGPLAGSALSPATWRQSVEALRELTVRSRAGA